MTTQSPEETPKPRRVVLLLGVFAIAAAAAVIFGVTTRAKSKQEVADWTEQQAVPTVRTVQPELQ